MSIVGSPNQELFLFDVSLHSQTGPVSGLHLSLHQDQRPASGGSGYAALLQNFATDRTLDGGETGAARVHPQSARTGAIDPRGIAA